MKRKFLLFVMVVLMLWAIAETVYIIVNNPNITINLVEPAMSATLMKYTVYTLMNGMIIGIAFIGLVTARLKDKIEMLKMRDEANSINSDESTAEIKVLKNKIKTLEAALDKAVKDN